MGIERDLDFNDIDFNAGYIALIDKPLEWTSTDVVRKVKYSLQRKGYPRKIKVGHAGTLDPLASGVLLICVGKATKRVDELQSERKEILPMLFWGRQPRATTWSTQSMRPIPPSTSPSSYSRCVEEFEGERLQSPPLYSAKKVEVSEPTILHVQGRVWSFVSRSLIYIV